MPCSDQYPTAWEEQRYKEQAEIKRRLDLSTRLLCTVMRRLRKLSKENEGYPEDRFPADQVYDGLLGMTEVDQVREVNGLREWWINHQREDRERAKAGLRDARNEVRAAEREILQHTSKIAAAQKRLAAAKKTIAKATKGKK